MANLPPPVPKKTSSTSAMIFHREEFEVGLFVFVQNMVENRYKPFEFGGGVERSYIVSCCEH